MPYISFRAKVDADLDKAIVGGINATTAKAVKFAQPITPVDTRRLQASERNEPAVKRGNAWVGAFGSFGVPYAIHVEKGTRFMAGHFMLQRAADQTFPDLPKEIRSRLR